MDDLNEILGDYREVVSSGIVHPQPLPKSEWLFELCHETLGMNDDKFEVGLQPETHMEFCQLLEEAFGECTFRGGKQTLYLIELPRGGYKTSIAGEGVPVGVTVRNPNARGLIVTHRQDVSRKRLKSVKWHFARNPDFQDKYGDDWKPGFQEEVWSDSQITVSKRTQSLREPTLDTASVGKDMTGSHYDYIIADDLVQRENIRNPEQRTEVYEYLMSLLALLDPGGVLIVIGTRWHPDDAYGRIIKNDERLERDGKSPEFTKYIKSCWDGPDGLWFPKKLTREFLEITRRRTGSRFFAANYENKPVADEDRLFNMELAQIESYNYLWNGGQGFVRWRDKAFPVDTTLSWDPAGRTPSRNSDAHGFTVVGTDQHDRWWTLEAQAYKALPSSVIDRACNLIAYYHPWCVIIESVGGYGLWIDLLQQEIIRRGLMTSILEDKVGSQSKNTRISMIEPRWNNQSIFLKAEHEVLFNQLSEFDPSSTMVHEDVLDSFSKHHGNTIAAQDIRYKLDNPYDPEWAEYLRNNKPEDKNAPHAGRFGSRWSR